MRRSRDLHARRRLAALLLPGTLMLAGCDRLPGDAGDDAVATVTAGAEDPAPPAADEPPPLRIYYDLTQYDWYAHGEPLVLGADSYAARPGLRAADRTEMERAGEYHGVEAYTTAEDDSTVYVPVFPGYWQPFVRSPSARTPD